MSDEREQLKETIAALEADYQTLKAEGSLRIKALRAEIAQRAEESLGLAAKIDALIGENATLRQPCRHEPMGSDPDCVWCRVRTHLVNSIDLWYQYDREKMGQRFDAAVQAVREG
jgi:cell division protein FtsB